MSEVPGKFDPHEARIAAAANDLFILLHTRLRNGEEIPSSDSEPAQRIAAVPEISNLCFATIDSAEIDKPSTIEVQAHKVSTPVAVTYWLSPIAIEGQHFGFDENHDPYPLNQRHVVNFEELVDLHSRFF